PAPDAATGAPRSTEQLEAEIAALEARVATLEGELVVASEQADIARITTLAEEYDRQKAHLDALYSEWQDVAS
nr:ABC transporter ATP-binding protein [Ktedonobacterales bacterium]